AWPDRRPDRRPERDRRAAVVLIAGVLAVVLALAGLTYALLHRGGGGGAAGRANDTASTGRAGGGAHSPAPSGAPESDGAVPPPAHGTPSASGEPAQSVKVRLAGAHTAYAGTCPPPAAQAPSFTATFTVGRLPAKVEYRWVLKHGSVSDPGWRTLSFPAGGDRSGQVRVTVTAYSDAGTIRNEIAVEVRGPVRVTSESVPFSVTCVTAETPSAGASASASGSPGSSP
ncbi:serine/threonine protein kinase, partial [Streptomyces sp. NPDC096012]